MVEPFLLTVNTVCLQFIEHLDQGGFFGNLNDVLAFLISDEKRRLPAAMSGRHGLSPNKPIPGLLIPPEHRQRMQPFLLDLERIAH